MEFRYSTYRIHLRHTFTISRSSRDFYDIVYIYLINDGIMGVGEAVPSVRYNESFDRFIEVLQQITFNDVPNSESLDELLDSILPRCQGVRSLEAAFDVAVHDYLGKIHGRSIYDQYSAESDKTPLTSFTIGIDKLDLIQQKLEEADPYPILKVKLGGEDDRAIIRTIRDFTDKLIRVDANEGWNLNEAQKMCDWLSEMNVEFVEQPLPSSKLDEMLVLKDQSPLKIIADENCMNRRDIPQIAQAFNGINIKLMKCGGLREAYRMILLAREMDLEIMLGCMIESSVAVTAAAHLSPLVDYADLDGNLLINNDPYVGVGVEAGKLILPDSPGLGICLV